jgi:peptidoglycan hydrolase CwlO-like protein
MITDKKMEQQVENIKNKICPSDIDNAVLYLFTELTKVKHENDNLKQEIKELYWRLQEHD